MSVKGHFQSTYQHDFSNLSQGFRGRAVSALNAQKMSSSGVFMPLSGRPATKAGYEASVTVDGRSIGSVQPYEPKTTTYNSNFAPQTYDLKNANTFRAIPETLKYPTLGGAQSRTLPRSKRGANELTGVTIDGREVQGLGGNSYLDNYKSTGLGASMQVHGSSVGAPSRPMAWNAGGSTKPPMVDNYLDSYGLNAGLGNASYTKFPTAARMANYTRYSPGDWASSNMSHFNSADNARNNSERVRSEAIRLMRDREDRTVLTQRDADRRIGERLHDVAFWRSELQSELERNMNETHHLMETRKNLERALAETEGPMRITSECIYHREGRKGIDLVNDLPENSLMREVDTIKASQDKMRKTLEQVNYQLGVNRNARHQLERDLANKDQAIAIDHTCHQLQNTSRAINLHGGVEKMDPNVSIPDTWAENSNHNIQESQGEFQLIRSDV
eukprot:maker-scaffold1285_size50744-snap-gene-0.13 protein:Tk12014 transcript:maker-scaffold1285_size50744-snap-gene-0.13-mRNA-1 annotation:"Tektin-3"